VTWVVTVHSTGGSMAEAVDVQWAITTHTEDAAKTIAEALNSVWYNQGDEDCAQYFEAIPAAQANLPLASAQTMAAEGLDPSTVKPGEVALDIRELARMLTEGEPPEPLPEPPKPPTEEEESEALASIARALGRDA
jgi:hypothetical protein